MGQEPPLQEASSVSLLPTSFFQLLAQHLLLLLLPAHAQLLDPHLYNQAMPSYLRTLRLLTSASHSASPQSVYAVTLVHSPCILPCRGAWTSCGQQ